MRREIHRIKELIREIDDYTDDQLKPHQRDLEDIEDRLEDIVDRVER